MSVYRCRCAALGKSGEPPELLGVQLSLDLATLPSIDYPLVKEEDRSGAIPL